MKSQCTVLCHAQTKLAIYDHWFWTLFCFTYIHPREWTCNRLSNTTWTYCTQVCCSYGITMRKKLLIVESAKEANHSSKHKTFKYIYLPALISFIANPSNSVSTKSPFAARDYRNKIIIHRRQTCGIACKVDTEQPLEFLASFWDYGWNQLGGSLYWI